MSPTTARRLLLLLVYGAATSTASGQSWTCRTGSVAELRSNIVEHETHSYNLSRKFVDTYYHRGPLPPNFKRVTHKEVEAYLKAVAPDRRAALLFYAYDSGRLCAWLLSPRIPLTASVVHAGRAALFSLSARLRNALHLTAVSEARAPQRRLRPVRTYDASAPQGSPSETLRFVSSLLFPDRIRRALERDTVRTLIIVPVSTLGLVPFSALPFGDKRVVDVMAVIVAPGFFAIRQASKTAAREFAPAVIAGDPTTAYDTTWEFPPLPGARAEASEIAKTLANPPLLLLDTAASSRRITGFIASHPETQLVYVAAHGVADAENPLDGSFLQMSDGRWHARDVQNLHLRAGPLVVLSACGTGLGKDFEIGTIGMARAWQRAGASAVVMSLWNVEDLATQSLMTEFLGLAKGLPPEEALRRAMQTVQARYPQPSQWSGFAVFGVPAQ